MKMIVVFQFIDFDESNKELAMETAIEFSGVTKVQEVEGGEGQLEVWGEFSPYDLTKELKKIDKSAEIIKIGADGVTEPEVKIQQRDEGKLASNIQQAFKRPSDDIASSSDQRGVPGYGYLGQAMGVGFGAAKLAKDVGVGAAGKAINVANMAKDMGVGAAGKAIGYGIDYYQKKNYQEEAKAKVERKPIVGKRENWLQFPKANAGGVTGVFEALVKNEEVKAERWRKVAEEMRQKKAREEEERRGRKQAEVMKQKKAKEEEERRGRKQAEEMKQKKVREEEERRRRRKQAEEMEQRKIRLEEEKKKMRERDLAIKREEEKLKILKEKMKYSGGTTTWSGLTESLWSTRSTQRTGETSTWRPPQTGETTRTQQPGQASTSTQRRKDESKEVDKKGKSRQ